VASNNIIRNTIFQNIGIAIVSAKSKNVSKIGIVEQNRI